MAQIVKYTTEEFIAKAIEVHGDTYDYSNAKYVNTRTKVKIICSTHSEFTQLPNGHIQGMGCRKCAYDKRKTTQEQFIKEATKIHNGAYCYDSVIYEGRDIGVEILCKKHGYFKQTPHSHLSGAGCKSCARYRKGNNKVEKTKQFVEKAKIVHGDTYDYSLIEYIGALDKVNIICKEHGMFKQTASNHLCGSGCPLCVNSSVSSWSRSDYIKKANGRLCTFYTIRCFNEEEEFYKIGITMRSVKERYPGTKTMPYAYEIISEIFGEAGFIWNLEVVEKRKLKNHHYSPKIDFNGSKTECFSQLIKKPRQHCR